MNDSLIHCDGQVKILGHNFSSDNSNTAALNDLMKAINFKLFNLNKVHHCTNYESRIKFMTSFVLGQMAYLFPLYFSAS